MIRHLFLTGTSGVGKTTLLLNSIAPCRQEIGGFLTVRLLDETGETAGFRLCPIEEAEKASAPYNKNLSGIFIERTQDSFKKHPEVFDDLGVKLLQRAREKKLCILDEVGGVELVSNGFYEEMTRLFDDGPPCFGVLKALPNLIAMEKKLPLPKRQQEQRISLEKRILEGKGKLLVCPPWADIGLTDIKASVLESEEWKADIGAEVSGFLTFYVNKEGGK